MPGETHAPPRIDEPIGEGGFPSRLSRLSLATLIVLLVLTVADAAMVRGYITTFWGDYGVWLHQVERFAQGQIPYRDFYFAAPPLSIWLVGSVAKITGADLASAFLIMNVVFVAVMISYWFYVVQLLPSILVPFVVLSGFVLAVAYATIASAPLALGMYKPAVPIGFLCLMLTLALARSYTMLGGVWRAGLLGALAALCILAKQDFWLPALSALIGVCWVRLVTAGDNRGVGTLWAAFALTVSGAASLVAAGAGVDSLVGVATGYRVASESLARALPSWRLITIETIAGVLLGVGLLGCLVLTRVRIKRLVPTTIGLLLSLVSLTTIYIHFEDGAGFNVATLRVLRDSVYGHLFPTMLPALIVVMVICSRNERGPKQLRAALILLGIVCTAARVRRGFEHVEWYHFLLELPLYVLAVEFFFGKAARSAAILAVLGLALIGVNLHFRFGVGPLSREGERALTVTPRGPVHWDPWNTQEFKAVQELLNELDPSGERSVFQFGGHNGALNYFLKRPTTTSITEGFLYAAVDPDSALSGLLETDPPLFLVYDHLYDTNRVPQRRIDWRKWDKPTQRNRHSEYDAPYFNRLKVNCVPFTLLASWSSRGIRRRDGWRELMVRWSPGEPPSRRDTVQLDTGTWARITVYDCARTGEADRIVAEVNGRLPRE